MIAESEFRLLYDDCWMWIQNAVWWLLNLNSDCRMMITESEFRLLYDDCWIWIQIAVWWLLNLNSDCCMMIAESEFRLLYHDCWIWIQIAVWWLLNLNSGCCMMITESKFRLLYDNCWIWIQIAVWWLLNLNSDCCMMIAALLSDQLQTNHNILVHVPCFRNYRSKIREILSVKPIVRSSSLVSLVPGSSYDNYTDLWLPIRILRQALQDVVYSMS